MVIPELIRLLKERGIEEDEGRCHCYGCLRLYEPYDSGPKPWKPGRYGYLEQAVPLLPVIGCWTNVCAKNSRILRCASLTTAVNVHMAHIDIHFTHSVNGVAALHTDILKKSELHNFMSCIRSVLTTRPTESRSEDGSWTAIRVFRPYYEDDRGRLEKGCRRIEKIAGLQEG